MQWVPAEGREHGRRLALSQHNTFLVTAPMTVINGPITDDGFEQVSATACGGPGGGGWNFGGTVQTDLFANSNGSLTAVAGNGDFSASVAEFLTGEPRLAGLWSDLSPNVAGTTTVTVAGGVLQYDIAGVPEFGAPATLNTVTMIADSNTDTLTINAYASDAAHATDTLVGFSPGNGATDPGPVSFLSLVGAGPQVNAATDAVYEFAAGAAVPAGFTSIQFSGGANSWIVN